MNTTRLRSARLLPIVLSLLAIPVAAAEPPSKTVDPVATPQAVDTDALLALAREDGPHEVARLRSRDGLRNGPDYRGGTIHYPTSLEGPLPIVVICPGFMASEGSVRSWGPFLASHGIVAMTIGTNSPRDRPFDRGRALLDGLETARAENTREGSPLKGRIAVDRGAVAGWSMGGGGAQHAAVKDPTLKAAVAFVPWQPGYRFDHEVPVLILGGSRDSTASTRANARPHFEGVDDDVPKLLYEIEGGNHMLPSDPGNHGGDVGAWTLAWLKVYLEGDERYRGILERRPKTASIYDASFPDAEAPVSPRPPSDRPASSPTPD
ncbi:MAG: hypothetical protein VX726_12760 [Planctomycetota bacterium]|nr:hypothetical protein [Planctomycetota bacterium]